MRKNRSFRSIMLPAAAVLAVLLFIVPRMTVFAENITGADYEKITVDPAQNKEGYSAVLYNNLNGLPTSEANAITETAEGFIWIGSYSGLIRYDGNNFERMDSVSTGITSVVSLYVDSKNRLWIGTNDNGVIVMDHGEFTQYNRIGGMKSSSIRSITEDHAGNIYIATTHGIGIFDENMEFELMDESQIYDDYIQELRVVESGIIYGKTLNGAIFTIENRKLSGFYDSSRLGVENVKSILPDEENPGYIYIGTQESEIYYGNLKDGAKGFIKFNVSPLKQINSMEKVGGELWICADNGIAMRKPGEFQVLKGLPMDNSIDQMLVDYEGNLWFTSSRQGVMKIVSNPFTDLFERIGHKETVVNSTCVYDNKLFVGTDEGLIVLNSLGEVESLPISAVHTNERKLTKYKDLLELLKDVRIRSVYRDSNGRIWFSTYGDHGLVMYDGKEATCYTAADGLPSARIRTCYETGNGDILVACTGGLAFLNVKTGIYDVFDEQSGLSNSEILTVAEADNGDIILGSNGDGIYIITDGFIRNVGFEEGLSSEVILRIRKDEKRGIFWIITSNSIAYMTSDYQVNTITNFPYSNNFDLVENSKGEMWILSSNGIYVAKTEELLANEEIETDFYSHDNGLPCVATANSYSDVSEDGILYIAGTSSVVRIDIEADRENDSDTKMAVPYIEADGVRIYSDDNSFTIPANTKRLTVYGFVYTYSLMNPRVSFRLQGFDQESTVVNRSELEPIDYTNLKGGNYSFVMEILDSTGNPQSETTVEIYKEKALYEQLWFIVLMVALGIFTVLFISYLVIKARTASLERKAAENKIFIREMAEAFAKVIEWKDEYTKGHSMRVAKYTAMLTKELGYDDETVDKYYNIALLHDIGKLRIPPEVLNKNGKLTDEEFKTIKSHSGLGYSVLKDISIMPELAIGAGAHHERPDGKGYPKGLKGDEIPRVAQIIAVADTFDAMYSDRPYRRRMNFDKAVSIIQEVSGTQLASDVVDAFLKLVAQGEFKDPNDEGGGSMESIDNIHKKYEDASKKDNNVKPEEKEKTIEEKKQQS